MEREADLGALRTNQWNFLQEQMSRLVQAWREGDPGDLERFLPPPNDLLRAITLQELILTDLEMRWRSGEHVSLDYYVGKYPELGSLSDLPTKLICEEFRIRQRYGDTPHLLSYKRRFPRQFSELEILLEQHPPTGLFQEPHSPLLNPFAGIGIMPNQNAVVNGYKLIKRMASGAFADVWEAEAPGGIRVAIKVIRQSLSNEDAQRELESLEMFKQLSHVCLVQLHSFWVHEDRLCVVMDLADCTLRDRLQECKEAGTLEGGIPGIPPRELLAYFRDAAEALDYLHSEKILHRDVKPANILLFRAKRVRATATGSGEGFLARAKLADFGLARLVESQRLSASGGGTLAYMAPEACRNRTNPQSDLYSLAASYAELRLGRPLFPYTNMFELTRAHLEETPDLAPLPNGEQKVLLRALAKESEERFPTCQQFISALEETLPLPGKASTRTALSVAGYRLIRLIGGGARGELWEAVAEDGTHFAMTVIRNLPWAQAAEECRTLQFLRDLSHPNLARLHDAFLLDNQEAVVAPEAGPPPGSTLVKLCIVGELLPESLGQRLDQSEKGIPPRELIRFMWQAAEALDTLRGPYPVGTAAPAEQKQRASLWPFGRGKQLASAAAPETVTVVHAAISPRSLLVDGSNLKVGDYALVKLVHSTQGLLPGDETLLPGYVAPELYHRQAHTNSDQYSLAITYVELRTGRSPFQSSAPSALMALQREGKLNLKRLPDGERDVIKKATALSPADRYASCHELVAALEEACFTSGIRVTKQAAPSGEKKVAASPAPPKPVSPTTTGLLPNPEDSGEFNIPPREPAAKKPVPAAAAPVSQDTDGRTLGAGDTLRRVQAAALEQADDRLLETRDAPPPHVEKARGPAPGAKATPRQAAKTGEPDVPRQPVPERDPGAPPRKAGRDVSEAPAEGKPRKRSMAVKLGVTVAALVFVVGAGFVIHAVYNRPNGTTSSSREPQIRALIQDGKHADAVREIRAASKAGGLTQETARQLDDANALAWYDRASSASKTGDTRAALDHVEGLLVHYQVHSPAQELRRSLKKTIAQKRVGEAYTAEGLKLALDAIEAYRKDYPEDRATAEELQEAARTRIGEEMKQTLTAARAEKDPTRTSEKLKAGFLWGEQLRAVRPEFGEEVQKTVLEDWIAFGRTYLEGQPQIAQDIADRILVVSKDCKPAVQLREEAQARGQSEGRFALLDRFQDRVKAKEWSGARMALEEIRAALGSTIASKDRDALQNGLIVRAKEALLAARDRQVRREDVQELLQNLEAFKFPQLTSPVALTRAVLHLRGGDYPEFLSEFRKAKAAPEPEASHLLDVLAEAGQWSAAAEKVLPAHWDVAKELLPHVGAKPAASGRAKAVQDGYCALVAKLVTSRYADLGKSDEFKELLPLYERAVEAVAQPDARTWACFAECFLLQDTEKFRKGLPEAELWKVAAARGRASADASEDAYVAFVRGLSSQARREWSNAAAEYQKAFASANQRWQTTARSGLAGAALFEAGRAVEKEKPREAFAFYEKANSLTPGQRDYQLRLMAAALASEKPTTFENTLRGALKKPGLDGWDDASRVELAHLFVRWADSRINPEIGTLPDGMQPVLLAALVKQPDDPQLNYWTAACSWARWRAEQKAEDRRDALTRFARMLGAAQDSAAGYEKIVGVLGEDPNDRKDLLDRAIPPEKQLEKRHLGLLKQRFELIGATARLIDQDLMNPRPLFSQDAERLADLEADYGRKAALHAQVVGEYSRRGQKITAAEKWWVYHDGKLEELLLDERTYQGEWREPAVSGAKIFASDPRTKPADIQKLNAFIKKYDKPGKKTKP